MNSKFFFPALPGESPGGDGYFGAFGGKFIPEALVAAVDEVAIEYEKAKADPGFVAEFERLLSHYAGRPSALTEVPRFAGHAGGARVFLAIGHVAAAPRYVTVHPDTRLSSPYWATRGVAASNRRRGRRAR